MVTFMRWLHSDFFCGCCCKLFCDTAQLGSATAGKAAEMKENICSEDDPGEMLCPHAEFR